MRQVALDRRARFDRAYDGLTVLVTGHTGFKGSWLCHWLAALGARVVGYSLAPPSSPSMFDASGVGTLAIDERGDIRDADAFWKVIDRHRPAAVFHLAAQSLVGVGYREPVATVDVNVLGTVTVLEQLRRASGLRAIVCVSSDKCYENREWSWGYRETDALGGLDPYSMSKACMELAVASYIRRSRATADPRTAISSARAGNVIGGGDWAQDRLIPDVARALSTGSDIELRQPTSTRPWQHVLEPLSGYLALGARLLRGQPTSAAYNFGPHEHADYSVLSVVEMMRSRWQSSSRVSVGTASPGHEAGLLRLDCSLARAELGWWAVNSLGMAIDETVAWYRAFYDGASPNEMREMTEQQIEGYELRAQEQGVAWATAH